MQTHAGERPQENLENEDYITEEMKMYTDTYRTPQKDPRTIPIPHRKDHIIEENDW